MTHYRVKQNLTKSTRRIRTDNNWLAKMFIIFAIVLQAGGTLQAAYAAQTQQHSWVADIPITPLLTVEPALGIAFDSPNGRIVMIFASSTSPSSEIIDFYNNSLAAIGWVGSDGEWRKGLETFIISEVNTTVGVLWRLVLRPH